MPKIDEFKITAEFFTDLEGQIKDGLILNIASHYSTKTDVKGYLLSQSDEDRVKDLIHVSVFNENHGMIMLNDWPMILPYTIGYFIRLNRHALIAEQVIGQFGEDFTRGRISAALTFQFNLSATMAG